MTGDYHVRFCEGLGVRFPRATRRAIVPCSFFEKIEVCNSINVVLKRCTHKSLLTAHLGNEESSSPGESHPQALTDPDVNLSIHPALIAQPSVASPFANGQIDWVPSSQCVLTNRLPSVRGA